MASNSELKRLERMVGSWETEARHPAMPAVTVRGQVEVEWLEGQRFLIHRSRMEHPDFPDSISIIGATDQDRVAEGETPERRDAPLQMHYFDSRGVFRIYEVSSDESTLRMARQAPGFSQRFTGTFADGGDTIDGRWQVCEDDVHWNDDLEITYRRRERAGR